jgi:nucleoside-diphosphate-sugar epimerase
VAFLRQRGHHVTVFHRGNHAHNVPPDVDQIIAPRDPGPAEDRYHLRAFAGEFRARRPDVVVHMIAFTREDAEAFVRVFKGLASRAVVVSSSDVYRPMGILNRTESGPPVSVPIDEDGDLRRELSIHGARSEKRWVEEVVRAEPTLPATILRLPAVYGPGSYRRQEWIKRMADNRRAIILGKGWASFRFSHGYARDVGYAAALAAMDERSAGRVYNVGELNVPTERQRLADFARAAGWTGRIVEVPDEIVPGGDGLPFPGQDWLLDTTRIRSELGFAEVSDYHEGIRATIDWQRRHPNPKLNPSDFDYAAEDRLLADTGL